MIGLRVSIALGAALVAACSSSPGETEERCPASIDDGDACTADACDPATGAVSHLPTCHDSNGCTGDTCSSTGACSHEVLDITARAVLSGSLSPRVEDVLLPTLAGGDLTVCPEGPNPSSNPPSCILELDFEYAALTFDAVGGGSFRILGTLPARVQNLPAEVRALGSVFTGSIVLNGGGTCPGVPQTFVPIPIDVTIDEGTVAAAPLGVAVVLDEVAVEAGVNVCGTSLSLYADLVRPFAAQQIVASAAPLLVARIEAQLCLSGPNCPAGTTQATDGLCRYDTGLCAARGIDAQSGAPIVPACAE